MKPEDVIGGVILIALIIGGCAAEYWYEFKFKPQRYAEEFIKAQQKALEKSK